MCLAIPGRVVSCVDDQAQIDYSGVTRHASTMLCPSVKEGDAVLVHAGFIIQILDEKSAKELLDLYTETTELSQT